VVVGHLFQQGFTGQSNLAFGPGQLEYGNEFLDRLESVKHAWFYLFLSAILDKRVDNLFHTFLDLVEIRHWEILVEFLLRDFALAVVARNLA
jgi:hypothetical protein